MNKQLFRFTLFLLVSLSLPSIAAGQVEISAVSSAANPAVGDTIEVSINIAGASDVAGYGFTLTFNPTELEFISIENADYLPSGATAFPPIVESGSVVLGALVSSGAAEGDGTLAVATFRVLVDTETTVRFERVQIGNPEGQPIEIASIRGATINATTSMTDSTTETQEETPTAPTTTTPTTPITPTMPTTPDTSTTTPENVLVTGVRISAVSSASNPAVGDTIEVSINIAGASDVAGYGFTLRFNPTELEFISIENADYLPSGATAFPPIVESGSVVLGALVSSGAAEGDGTLAVATFRVLVDTETTVRFERVQIGNPEGQPIEIASIRGATINRGVRTEGAEIEYLLSIPAGIGLIHIPLRVNAVDGQPWTITSISDLYDILGGQSNVIYLFTRASQTQEWIGYLRPSDRGTSVDRQLTDDMGIVANLITPTPLRLRGSSLGTNGNSTIRLNPGTNLVGVPLRDSRITDVSDLFTLEGIADNVQVIIFQDNDGEFKQISPTSSSADIAITGGQSFIMTASRTETVIIYGDGWTNIR